MKLKRFTLPSCSEILIQHLVKQHTVQWKLWLEVSDEENETRFDGLITRKGDVAELAD